MIHDSRWRVVCARRKGTLCLRSHHATYIDCSQESCTDTRRIHNICTSCPWWLIYYLLNTTTSCDIPRRDRKPNTRYAGLNLVPCRWTVLAFTVASGSSIQGPGVEQRVLFTRNTTFESVCTELFVIMFLRALDHCVVVARNNFFCLLTASCLRRCRSHHALKAALLLPRLVGF